MKRNKLPSLIILMILTLITTLFWISFNIFRVFTRPIKIDVPKEIIQELNPTFDTNTINMIKSKNI